MRNLLISVKYLDGVPCGTSNWSLRLLIMSAAFLICGINSVYAQTPPCPSSGSSTTFTFAPNSESDSTTQTINLAPCETIEIRETHDMGGNGERGTNLRVSYLNSSGQEIYAQGVSGFYSSPPPYNSIPLQDSYDEPFPWVGVASSIVLPATLKIESSWPYGQGGVGPPEYNFTIIRTPRPGYNVGGTSIADALLVSSLPTTYNGSLRKGAAADCQTNCGGSPPPSPPDPDNISSCTFAPDKLFTFMGPQLRIQHMAAILEPNSMILRASTSYR
jgi:hypothetical protein